MDIKEKVTGKIRENRERTMQLLKKMIRQPSVRGNEGKAQAIVVEKCRQLGLKIDLWDLDETEGIKEHVAFHCDRLDFTGNPNLVAVLAGTGEGKSLILNGHIDVVPEGNPEDWELDPYSGEESEGRMYGRGATDMKGGNAALLAAMEAIILCGVKLKGDVIFQSVIEEESGGAGTLAAVLRGYEADGAIIPEPTNMKFFTHQQGSMWFRLTVKGKAAHGGTRYEGVSGIDLAYDVLSCVKRLETERNEKLRDDPLYKNVPIPIPINIGRLHSGNWPSSVPDLCVLEGRFGVSPHETMEEAMRQLEEAISDLNGQHAWFRQNPVQLEWFGARWLPGKLKEGELILRVLEDNYRLVKKSSPAIEASPWGTDGGILSSVGNTPVIVFGPGKTEKAHDSNEYIEVDAIFEAAEILACFIIDWCGIDEQEGVV